jgi:hypothetical protein
MIFDFVEKIESKKKREDSPKQGFSVEVRLFFGKRIFL